MKDKIFKLTGYKMAFEPNPIQLAALRPMFSTNQNVIISAGTGTGKTVIYEWGMHKALSAGQHVVVLAPNKALVEQKAAAWRDKDHSFSQYSLTIKTGDYLGVSIRDLVANQIKIMTPEAFAVALRSRSAGQWIRLVGVLVVDEIHTIGTEKRGNGLEACITNFFLQKSKDQLSRIVGASASIDATSLRHLMDWINRIGGGEVEVIRSDWRPTPISHEYLTYRASGSYTTGERNKQDIVLGILAHRKTISAKPALIFVHTKNTGYQLTEKIGQSGARVAFHCADFPKADRARMEQRFTDGELDALVATSTLAVGCDFPVEDVIITGVHRGLNPVELDTLQQMAGRAGHQGCCEKGVVWWVLPDTDAEEWKEYLSGEYEIKSELGCTHWLSFHLIGEIARNGMATLEDLEQWYCHTLAYVQDGHNCDLLEAVVTRLLEAEAIRVNNDEEAYYVTLLGNASAKFYFDPMDVHGWYHGVKTLSSRDHKRACGIVGSANTMMADFAKEMTIDGIRICGAESFLNLLITDFSGENFSERENMPPAIRMSLYTLYKELQRLTACMSFLAAQEPDLSPRVKNLEDTVLKIIYGVPDEVLELIRLRGVGRVRAMKLYNVGLKTPEDLLDNRDLVLHVLGNVIGAQVYQQVADILDPAPF